MECPFHILVCKLVRITILKSWPPSTDRDFIDLQTLQALGLGDPVGSDRGRLLCFHACQQQVHSASRSSILSNTSLLYALRQCCSSATFPRPCWRQACLALSPPMLTAVSCWQGRPCRRYACKSASPSVSGARGHCSHIRRHAYGMVFEPALSQTRCIAARVRCAHAGYAAPLSRWRIGVDTGERRQPCAVQHPGPAAVWEILREHHLCIWHGRQRAGAVSSHHARGALSRPACPFALAERLPFAASCMAPMWLTAAHGCTTGLQPGRL